MLRKSSDEYAAGRRVAELYAAEAAAVFRFAYHVCGNRADAEDLLQTAFLELHRFLLRGDEPANPRAWLVVVVKRRAFNLRRDRRDAPSDQLETLAGAIAEAPDASDQLAKVRATLWSLPEAQHQAFVLRHWSGLSYDEIASVLSTTPAAVESLLVRSRAAVMAEDGADEACIAVRERLCEGAPLAPLQMRHLDTCRRCSTARSRLAQATGIAAAMLLVPRAHVAQALASTIPGFTAKAAMAGAAGSAGSAGPGAAVAGAGKAGLVAKGAIAAVALVGTAGAIHSHVGRQGGSSGPAFHHAALIAPVAANSSGSHPKRDSTAGVSVGADTDAQRHHEDHRAGAGRTGEGGSTGSVTGGSDGSSVSSQGSDGQGPSDQGSGAQPSGGGGSGTDSSSDGSSSSQDSGGSSQGSSSDAATGGDNSQS